MMCPMIYIMCGPGKEHQRFDPSSGGCNPYPCGNSPCVPCKDPSNCEGNRYPIIDPIGKWSMPLSNQTLQI